MAAATAAATTTTTTTTTTTSLAEANTTSTTASSIPASAIITPSSSLRNLSLPFPPPSSCHAPRLVLIVENPRRSTNWGPLVRCATAFDIAPLIVVGYDMVSFRGSHGASRHVPRVVVPTIRQAMDYVHRSLVGSKPKEPREEQFENANGSTIGSTIGKSHNNYSNNIVITIGMLGAYPMESDEMLASLEKDDEKVSVVACEDGNIHLSTYARDMETTETSSSSLEDSKLSKSRPRQSQQTTSTKSSVPKYSYPVDCRPWEHFITNNAGSTTYCIIMGRTARGLPIALTEHCDVLCHISHIAPTKTTAPTAGSNHEDSTSTNATNLANWINLESCLSITCHQVRITTNEMVHIIQAQDQDLSADVATTNQTMEQDYQGEKYSVQPFRRGLLGSLSKDNKNESQQQEDVQQQVQFVQEQRKKERLQRDQLADETIGENGLLDSIFGDD